MSSSTVEPINNFTAGGSRRARELAQSVFDEVIALLHAAKVSIWRDRDGIGARAASCSSREPMRIGIGQISAAFRGAD